MSQRIYLLDNIKVYLMLLVIAAHTLIASYGHNDKLIAWIWFFCLSYTMPLFTFISGFLSRPAWELKKNVRHLLIPFMVFSVVNICYGWGQMRTSISIGQFQDLPCGIYWYCFYIV